MVLSQILGIPVLPTRLTIYVTISYRETTVHVIAAGHVSSKPERGQTITPVYYSKNKVFQ